MVGKGGEDTYQIHSPSASCTWLRLDCLNPNRAGLTGPTPSRYYRVYVVIYLDV